MNSIIPLDKHNIINQEFSKSEDNINKLKNKLEQVSENGFGEKESKKLLKACEEFEAYFLYIIMKEMRKTVPKTGFIDGGKSEEIFRDMLDEEIAKKMAKSEQNSFGIANMIYKQLARPSL